jgi:osmoprotectant transport system permease protein
MPNVAALAALILSSPLGQVSGEFFKERSSQDATCVQENKPFCFSWAVDNFDRYTTPTVDHLILVVSSVVIGFAIAFGLAILSHRRRWLVPPILGTTGVLYTIPALAFFFLLLPLTGRGRDTAIIALSAYTLQIIFRNIVTGLNNVPEESKDAGRGMGMTERDLFWRVEVPLALPEIVAGIRIATVSTVALATLAVFAGAGGLGDPIYADLTFRTNILIAGGIAILMAVGFNLVLVVTERLLTPWRRVGARTA